MGKPEPSAEVDRLEALWLGDFGDAYIDRNLMAGDGRGAFWRFVFTELQISTVLEVGCNIGANLRWIAQLTLPHSVFGIDINEKALHRLRQELAGVNPIWSLARHLPFRDKSFDLVFTTGVLIHLPPAALPAAMAEIVRCSRRYVLCGEYYAPEPTEVSYRGQKDALFKGDFGALYLQLFAELRLVKTGFLAREQGGWDDLTFWIFEKSQR